MTLKQQRRRSRLNPAEAGQTVAEPMTCRRMESPAAGATAPTAVLPVVIAPEAGMSGPVFLHAADADTVRLADGSLRAVLECPTLPVASDSGRLRTSAAWGALGRQLSHPLQLVVHRRCGQPAPSRSNGGDVNGTAAPSRLRDSYERLLADLWPDRRTRSSRLYVVVSCHAGGQEQSPGEALERRVGDVSQALREAGIETVRVSAAAIQALVAETDFEEGRGHVRFGGRLALSLRITDCPAHLGADWLDALRMLDVDLDLSLHLRPPAVVSRGMASFCASLQLTVWADNRAALDEATRSVEASLGAHHVRSSRPIFEAEPAFISALPLGLNRLGSWRSLSSGALAGVLSFWSGDDKRERGLLYGVEPGSRRPLLLDRRALAEHRALVLGTDGSGKSSLLKVEVARARMAGTCVRVVDTCGGYTSLVKALGGLVIQVQPQQPPPFDAFAVMPGQPGALGARIACLQAAIELLAGGLTDQQSSELDYALSFVFAARGYTDDGDTSGLAAPLLRDVLAALENQMSRAFGEGKAQLDALRRALGRYVGGSGRWLFAGSAESRQDAPMVAYDLSGTPEEERAAATLLALDHACNPVAYGGRPALVVVDEIGELSRRPGAARFVARLAEKAAARLIGLRLATNEVTRLLQSPLRALVARPDLKVLMRQSPDAMPALAELLHLTPAEQSWLLAARTAEGLLALPDRRLAFELVMSSEEQRLITGESR